MCLAGSQAAGFALPDLTVHGTVKDSTGAAIKGADVTLKAGGQILHAQTDERGQFAFDSVAEPAGTLSVVAPGFVSIERKWTAEGRPTLNIDIAMILAGVSNQMTVTADRRETRIDDTAGSVIVLSQTDLASTAALTLDDALRQVEGFSLFRRTGSRTANPTTQGVSLRGVGASGASRALVIADGVPLNDPFGGWVYWDRIPRQEIGRVEVLKGAGSSLYGTDALGGVVNILRREPHQSWLTLDASYGNEQTPNGSLSAGGRLGNWMGMIAGEAFSTDGYFIVDPTRRGRIDRRAASEHRSLESEIERIISDQSQVFVRGSIFDEDRENGTPIDPNRTHIRQLEAGGNWSLSAGEFSVRLYGGTEVFDQRFASVAADRNSATLARSQRVPAQQIGLDTQWSRTFGSRQTAVAGLDAREVHGSSDELIFSANKVTSAVGAGGRERTAGLFGEDIIRPTSKWLLTLGVR